MVDQFSGRRKMRLLKVHLSTLIELRELNQKWRWSRPFSGKKSPHGFSDTEPSNLIISKFTHFKRPMNKSIFIRLQIVEKSTMLSLKK